MISNNLSNLLNTCPDKNISKFYIKVPSKNAHGRTDKTAIHAPQTSRIIDGNF